jgi:hypothetical protein
MNSQVIQASRVLCDFRTPHVQLHVLRAIHEAFNAGGATVIDEVAIME